MAEDSCCAVSCSMEKPTWQGTEGSLRSVAAEELNPAHNHLNEPESRTCPQLSLQMKPQLWPMSRLQPNTDTVTAACYTAVHY